MVKTHALISRLGLTPAASHVAEEVATWQGVETLSRPEEAAEASEVPLDGMTFRLGGRELGHLHGDSEAHISLSASVFDAVMKLGGAEASPWSEHQAIVAIRNAEDAERALWLFKLSAQAGEGEIGGQGTVPR
jgi:hypothetical protein